MSGVRRWFIFTAGLMILVNVFKASPEEKTKFCRAYHDWTWRVGSSLPGLTEMCGFSIERTQETYGGRYTRHTDP